MGTVDATVRLQALNGQWETCGADRAIGIPEEALSYTHDKWGPKTASFTLKRPVFLLWPDLGAFTPVEIEIGGVIVWEGRTSETPVKDGGELQINVQCEGWQAHLDDDVYQRVYVHSKLTDWKDTRSFLESNLALFQSSPQVQSGQSGIVLGFPKESPVVENTTCVGVILDLGPSGAAKSVALTHGESTFGASTYIFKIRGADTIGGLITGEEAYAGDPAGLPEVAGGAFTTTHRYVLIHVSRIGPTTSETADRTIKITGIKVFADSSYQSGIASILTGDMIEKDALERATLLLSTDHSRIAARSFAIPDFIITKASTPREAIEAQNAYYNYITKIGLGRRYESQPRPTAPVLEIGAWSGADTEDASANSGAEIYNRAIVEATGPDGSPLVVERSASQQAGVKPSAVSSPAAENPTFATNVEHWALAGGATLTRDTGVFRSTPASGRWEKGGTIAAAFSGTFKKGQLYRVTLYLKGDAFDRVNLTLGEGGDVATTSVIPPEGEFEQVAVAWVPAKDHAAVTLTLSQSGKVKFYVDDVGVALVAPTLVDRRGFRRTKIVQMSSAITEAEGNQLGDIFLQSHSTTPFKGSASLSPVSVRRVLGGQPVHPSQLGGYTEQLIRLSNLIDPDTGGVGRDGTIAEVAYDHKSQKAQITLDDSRGNFDALLNRLAIVQTPGS